MVRHFAAIGAPVRINGGITEYTFEGKLAEDPALRLRVEFQVNDNTPVIRFRYLLIVTSQEPSVRHLERTR